MEPCSTPLPFPKTYWVLPGKLLAGPHPGSPDPAVTDQQLHALLDCGVRSILNLQEAAEMDQADPPYAPYWLRLQELTDSRGLAFRWQRHPIPDHTAPAPQDMRRILNALDQALAEDGAVYLHCWGGVGRTGTVVGCYLARHGLAVGEQALERLNQLRQVIPNARSAPESEAQIALVRSWQIGA